MITSYEELLERFVQENVEFALAGGLAVCLNGFVRTTDDVDVLINNSPENIGRLTKCLADFGEGCGKDLTSADLPDEPGAIRIQEDFSLDLFVRMNGKTLLDFSSLVGLYTMKSGTQIPYLRAEALIQTKTGSSREKDRVDIGVLRDIIESRRNLNPSDSFRLDSVRSEFDSE